MTPQEIFDTVAKHLLAQEKQSVRADGDGCAYRGADGNKCAVGHLIPDEMYDEWMDNNTSGTTIEILLEARPEAFPSYFGENASLLGCLQSVHDAVSVWESDDDRAKMKGRLANVAAVNKLSPAVVQ